MVVEDGAMLLGGNMLGVEAAPASIRAAVKAAVVVVVVVVVVAAAVVVVVASSSVVVGGSLVMSSSSGKGRKLLPSPVRERPIARRSCCR